MVAYFVAAFAMALAASCFLILRASVDHFDPQEGTAIRKPAPAREVKAWSSNALILAVDDPVEPLG